ncbi:MAG: hypothetical protein HKL80_06900 [Acidimicrobiales bacterium]|nr:hypothetical protein [Acidimicrobiales bacterium]
MSSNWDNLLKLQELDSQVDHLEHEISILTLSLGLNQLEEKKQQLVNDLEINREVLEKAMVQISERDSESREITSRIKKLEGQLYGETKYGSKDLQNMSHELKALQARRDEIDDEELREMEEIEPVQNLVSGGENELKSVEIEIEETITKIGLSEKELRGEIEKISSEANLVRETVDMSVLEKYSKTRAGGLKVAASQVVHGSCGGCQMKLSATELDQVKHSSVNDLVLCEQCGCILVPRETVP